MLNQDDEPSVPEGSTGGVLLRMRPLPVVRPALFPAFSSGEGVAEAGPRPVIPACLSLLEEREGA